MKFNAWSKKRILASRKCLTSRKQRHENDPMVEDIVGPLPLWFIKDYLFQDEGAESPDELQRVINQIFSRKVHAYEMFYVHVLAENVKEQLKEAEKK